MSNSKALVQQFFHTTVEDKLKCAKEMHRKYQSTLLSDKDLLCDIAILKEFAQLLNAQMTQMRMGELCTRCAQSEGGGCCSLYMAGETDSIQLLMNLLAEVDVKQSRHDGVQCCFLGENGCIFLMKPFFCLNYNCTKIRETTEPEDFNILEHLTGQLLSKQYDIEKKLLDKLQKLMKS